MLIFSYRYEEETSSVYSRKCVLNSSDEHNLCWFWFGRRTLWKFAMSKRTLSDRIWVQRWVSGRETLSVLKLFILIFFSRTSWPFTILCQNHKICYLILKYMYSSLFYKTFFSLLTKTFSIFRFQARSCDFFLYVTNTQT